MNPEGRLIPDYIKWDGTIHVNLPEPLLRLINDLHADRQGIAAAGVVLVLCVVALTLKYLSRK